ncbi:unnamed protein product [Calicophoron daubneyi]|uniref:Golgi apparatus protein 1 n=1 Tax=Calicophoron daubneyi TaxID=300641 RepID=A0AAV2TE66_CALDB
MCWSVVILSLILIHSQLAEPNVVNRRESSLPAIEAPVNEKASEKPPEFKPLSLTDECKQDVQLYCSKHSDSDWDTIACLQKDEKTLTSLSPQCQNLLWQRKRTLTQQGAFESTLPQSCIAEFNNITACRSEQGSSFYVPCLVEHKALVKKKLCAAHLNLVAAFIFADYRLVYNFMKSCSEDIRRYECGRVDIGPSSPNNELNHLSVQTQGSTIRCLRKRIEKLEDNCRKQIFRIAELQSEDYHLDRPLYYACRDDRERLCPSIEAGEGRVYACLREHKYDQQMSEQCREAIRERQQLRASDYRINFRFTEACTADIARSHCQTEGDPNSDASLSRVMLCLEAVEKPEISESGDAVSIRHLSPECKSELTKLRRELLDDFLLSPDLIAHCDRSIERHCASKKRGRGAVLHCLLGVINEQTSITERPPEQCIEAVHQLLKTTDAEENILIDPVITHACRKMLSTKCAGLGHEDGAVYECLMAHHNDPSMGGSCRKHILELFYFISRDVTLDDHLYRACASDAHKFCKLPKAAWRDRGPADARILTCLYNHRKRAGNTTGEVLTPHCQDEVLRVVHDKAASVALEPRVFEVCLADLAAHCDTEYGDDDDEEEDDDSENEFGNKKIPVRRPHSRKGASGMACLQDNLNALHPECRKAVISVSAEAQEDPNLDKMIAEACVTAEQRFCGAYTNPSEVLNCLVSHKNDPEMSVSCRAAVEHMQLVALQDIQISKQFRQSCLPDAQKYCKNEMTVSKAAVVVCLSAQLTTHRLKEAQRRLHSSDSEVPLFSLKPPLSPECMKELVSELRQRSESIILDPELAKACENDRRRFCSTVVEGDAKVINCLRDHREELSTECHVKVFQREELVALENRADYTLGKVCQQMITVHCAPVVARLAEMGETLDERFGHHDLVECLSDAMTRDNTGPTFDPHCRSYLWKLMSLRSKDYRLDPELQESCMSDITKYCHEEAESTLNSPHERNGPVLHCLKKHFIEKANEAQMLSSKCYRRVRLLLRWESAAYHLDPVLAGACKAEVLRHCPHRLAGDGDPQNLDGTIRNCLQYALKDQKFFSARCRDEVILSIKEAETDIQVDPALHRACAVEVHQICGDIEPGQGRQMACLLRVLDHPDASSALGTACIRELQSRRDLWSHISRQEGIESVRDILVQVGTSHSRNIILICLFVFLSVIFICGLCCGRVTKRVPVEMKIK